MKGLWSGIVEVRETRTVGGVVEKSWETFHTTNNENRCHSTVRPLFEERIQREGGSGKISYENDIDLALVYTIP